MHHWAHAGQRDCDPWWENETSWHRGWKSLFPQEWREISHIAPDGEVHRADIKTPTGIVIEVQHSAMTDAERISRENFYGNLVWVIDGSSFCKNFEFHHLLPSPASDIARDLVWYRAAPNMNGSNHGLFVRVSECRQEYAEASKTDIKGGWIHGIREIQDQVDKAYCGHQQYVWKRPHKTWLGAKCPVYLDFGDEQLARLETYDESGLLCVFRVSKRKFVHDMMVETSARAIANRFYPLRVCSGS
jgi:competence CoiA-like predicted nuclease